MKNLTWQNPEQLFVAQVLINKVKSKCCGIKVYEIFPYVVSFSGASDYKNLWEKYGENGNGVCLVMNRKIMQPTVQSFMKDSDYLANVRYATEQNKIEKLSEVV